MPSLPPHPGLDGSWPPCGQLLLASVSPWPDLGREQLPVCACSVLNSGHRAGKSAQGPVQEGPEADTRGLDTAHGSQHPVSLRKAEQGADPRQAGLRRKCKMSAGKRMSRLSLAAGVLLASNTFPLEGDSSDCFPAGSVSKKESLFPPGHVSCVVEPRAAGPGHGGLESEKRNKIFVKATWRWSRSCESPEGRERMGPGP